MEEVLDGTDPLQMNEDSSSDLRDESERMASVLSIGGTVYQREQLKLQQQRRSSWVSCLCVVKFDTDYGPVLESSFPPTDFTEDELSNICFLSFPDSNSNLDGDTVYTFRLRRGGKEGEYEYGYVFFRQEKDDSMRRGYLQKSVVLLSKYGFSKLFQQVVAVIGPLFFQFGMTLLESSYQNILAWPEPQDGNMYELPILGKVLHYSIPTSFSLASTLPELPCNMYLTLQTILNDLWLLWELVVTGEPIIVYGASPVIVSETVLCIVNLISPLTFCGDYRPYFTIHDSDFKETLARKQIHAEYPSMIIGVTNPYFFKALEEWPNVLVIANQDSKGKKSFGGSVDMFSAVDWKPGLKAKSKLISDIDYVFLKKLPTDKPNLSNDMLQKRFLQQTLEFLSPLESYFQSLVPSEQFLSVFEPPPRIKPFREEQFLTTVAPKSTSFYGSKVMNLSPFLRRGGRNVDLYKRFIQSENFRGWLNSRKREANERIQVLYQKTMRNADIKALAKGKQDVELVNLYLRLKAEITQSQTPSYIDKLNEHVKELMPYLPPDAVSGNSTKAPPKSPVTETRWRDWEVV